MCLELVSIDGQGTIRWGLSIFSSIKIGIPGLYAKRKKNHVKYTSWHIIFTMLMARVNSPH